MSVFAVFAVFIRAPCAVCTLSQSPFHMVAHFSLDLTARRSSTSPSSILVLSRNIELTEPTNSYQASATQRSHHHARLRKRCTPPTRTATPSSRSSPSSTTPCTSPSTASSRPSCNLQSHTDPTSATTRRTRLSFHKNNTQHAAHEIILSTLGVFTHSRHPFRKASTYFPANYQRVPRECPYPPSLTETVKPDVASNIIKAAGDAFSTTVKMALAEAFKRHEPSPHVSCSVLQLPSEFSPRRITYDPTSIVSGGIKPSAPASLYTASSASSTP